MTTKTAEKPATKRARPATARSRKEVLTVPVEDVEQPTLPEVDTKESEPEVDSARYVEGLRVIEVRGVPSNLPPKANGEKIYRTGTEELVLEDGTSVYGCTERGCEEYGHTLGSMMRHRWNAHPQAAKPLGRASSRLKNDRKASNELMVAVSQMSVGEIIEQAKQIEQLAVLVDDLTQQRDEFRDRCMALEAQFRALSYALDRAGYVHRSTLSEDGAA